MYVLGSSSGSFSSILTGGASAGFGRVLVLVPFAGAGAGFLAGFLARKRLP